MASTSPDILQDYPRCKPPQDRLLAMQSNTQSIPSPSVDPRQGREQISFQQDSSAFQKFAPMPTADKTCVPNEGNKIITKLTIDLCQTYSRISPQFRYEASHNPRRVLTYPHTPVRNNGCDNEKGDLILYVHNVLGDSSQKDAPRYRVIDILGSGTFGQVARCCNVSTGELVAIKIVKNKTSYGKQGALEAEVIRHMHEVSDRHDRHHVLRLLDTFTYKYHLCLVFELLSVNLYELIKQNSLHGLSVQLVRSLTNQLLDMLVIMAKSNVIHCDLKPENILLKSLDSPEIKVIDFGSSCRENEQVYTYIQSRFYRSPEVLLGLRYSTAIDMWSLGCVVAELLLGIPLFPACSEYNLMTRMIDFLGVPPTEMIEQGKSSNRYFNKTDNGHFVLKSKAQYCKERNKIEKMAKRYFSTSNLDDIILKYRMPAKNMSNDEKRNEIKGRKEAIDFIRQTLQYDPELRITPEAALKHPFITGKWMHRQKRYSNIYSRKSASPLPKLCTPPSSPQPHSETSAGTVTETIALDTKLCQGHRGESGQLRYRPPTNYDSKASVSR